MGASRPWPDALEAFNGERTMTGKAIAEYFEPLRVWLEAENLKNKVHVGWTASDSKLQWNQKIDKLFYYKFLSFLQSVYPLKEISATSLMATFKT